MASIRSELDKWCRLVRLGAWSASASTNELHGIVEHGLNRHGVNIQIGRDPYGAMTKSPISMSGCGETTRRMCCGKRCPVLS
jgi:hypothetical protein